MAGHGGAREGSGRKSKAEEMGLPNLIEDVVGVDGKKELVKSLYDNAKKGSYKHLELLMFYMYGKPQDNIEAKIDGGITIRWEEPDVQPGQDQGTA